MQRRHTLTKFPSESNRRGVTVPHPRLAILNDDQFVIEQIARITNRPADEVRGLWQAELRSMGSNVHRALAEWGLPLYIWSDRLVQFYEQTDAFLYESLCWNLCGGKLAMR